MSQSTAKITFEAVGNKEDLMDVVTNISPTDTPFLSRFGKSKATAAYHEWTTDSLASAADNANIEAADYVFTKPASRSRTGAYVQYFMTPVEVSDMQRIVDKAGVEDEFAYQMTKKLKEHARDIEYALVTGTGNSGASGTARRLKGALAWITTNVTTGTGTGAEAITETMFNDTLQNIWTSGGGPGLEAYANGYQKRKISAFTASATKFQNASDKEVIAGVDVYDSDFGRVKIKLHRLMTTSVVAILTPDLWKVAVLSPTKKVDVAKIGAATRGVIETYLTLEARQEAGSGQIKELATS